MLPKEVYALVEADKAKLRSVIRKHEIQMHLNKMSPSAASSARTNVVLTDVRDARKRSQAKADRYN